MRGFSITGVISSTRSMNLIGNKWRVGTTISPFLDNSPWTLVTTILIDVPSVCSRLETRRREIISIFSTATRGREQISTYIIGEFGKTDESSRRWERRRARDSISIYSPCFAKSWLHSPFKDTIAQMNHTNTCSAICWHLYILLRAPSCRILAMHRAITNIKPKR